jgi:hypothetical protein
VRGQAYVAAHQGVEAAAEFQKILDHRGIVNTLRGPLPGAAPKLCLKLYPSGSPAPHAPWVIPMPAR